MPNPRPDPLRRRLIGGVPGAALAGAGWPLLCAAPAPAQAQPAARYRFQPAELHRVVADRNPLHDQTVTLIERRSEAEVQLRAQNRGIDAVELRLQPLEAENLRIEPPDAATRRWLLPPDGVAVTLATLRIDDPLRPPRYRYGSRITPGDSQARPDGSLYALPFPYGGRFRVLQGFGGSASHADAQNRHALDIALPVGTPVLAARGGVVVDFRRDAPTGTGRAADANYVIVRHADGTYGQYWHLDTGSVAVRLGAVVDTGTLLGRAGDSGQSSGPHLHFSVAVASGDGERRTVPWRFQDADGRPFLPTVGSELAHDP